MNVIKKNAAKNMRMTQYKFQSRQFAGDSKYWNSGHYYILKNKKKKTVINIRNWLAVHAYVAMVRLWLFVILFLQTITKIYLYDFDPLKSHFYIVKLEFTGVYIIFLISA